MNTQKAMNMNMKEWVNYYENKNDRERLLNVISLEFSHTKLETYVQQPQVVSGEWKLAACLFWNCVLYIV